MPHHNFPRWNLSTIFFSALPREMKRHLDAMVGGPFLKKSGAKDTFELLEELAKSEATEDNSRGKKSAGIHGIDKTALLEAELEKLRL